jgi:hypothetical protein
MKDLICHRLKVVFTSIFLVLVFIVGVGINAQAQTCNCKEYIYLDEPAIGAVLKFEVDPSMLPLIEVFGTNGGAPPAEHWYPGTGTSILPGPHGVAADLNGNIIIGASGGGPFYRLNCDGYLDPAQTPINAYGGVNNIFSVGNTIYSNGNGARAINSCTGDLIGTAQYRNNNGVVNDLDWHWGLAHNTVTGMVYATGRKGNSKSVWAATITQFNASIAGTLIINPLIGQGTNPTVNPGEKLFPAINTEINGIVGDNLGNIYVVLGNAIYKYDATGGFVASVSNPVRLSSPIGITWSETSNRLYVSNYTDDPAQDCIGVIDPVTMTYLGTGAPNPNISLNNTAKAIGILKECCPAGLSPLTNKNVCGGIGSKFYLNEEMFNLCDGVVCGSSWVPQGTLTGMTFDPCDNSVTITGNGCGTFSLNIGAVSSTGCGAQSSTVTICTALQPTVTANITNCNPGTNQYELTGSVTFTTPPATTGSMTVSVSGGGSQVFNAPFNSPINYSIGGLTLSGANRTVTVAFSNAPTCSATTSYIEPTSCPCESITNPSGTQVLCQGNSGANITVETSQNTTNGIRFVRFTTDQTVNNASPTAGELATIYAGTAIANVTPTGSSAPYTATLTTAAAGWNAIAPGTYYVYAIVNPDPGAACRRTQEIIVTVTAAPTAGITQTTPTCTGATPNNNGIITISSANNTTHFGISTAGALTYDGPGFPATTFTSAPQVVANNIPNTGGTYIIRLFNGTANCFTDQTVTFNAVTCVVACVPPSLSTVAATVCYGSSVNLSTLVTNNSPVGTISFHSTAANATAGTNPLLNSVVTPLSNTTFYVRSAISTTCFSTAAIQVTMDNPPTLSVHNAQICANSSVNLATLVDNNGGGSLSYFTSVANAQSNTNPLPSGVVSPLSATNYYIRSTTAAGCFTVKEVTITFATPSCNTIQVSGPN